MTIRTPGGTGDSRDMWEGSLHLQGELICCQKLAMDVVNPMDRPPAVMHGKAHAHTRHYSTTAGRRVISISIASQGGG